MANLLPRMYEQAEAANHIRVGHGVYHVIFNTFPEYLAAGHQSPFTVRDNIVNDNDNPNIFYTVDVEIAGITNQGAVEVGRPQDVLRLVRESRALQSDEFMMFLDGAMDADLEFNVWRVTTREGVNADMYQFRAYQCKSKFWGPLGRVNNCVVKQIANRVEGYYASGERRDYMWDLDTGERRSTDRLSPLYDSVAATKLAKDPTYTRIKKGINTFLSRRDCAYADTFGFDVRDLCELADLCCVRVRVWINSRVCPIMRWDTDDIVEKPDPDKRYLFDFWMTNTQHLELCQTDDTISNENNVRTISTSSPHNVTIKYVSDEWFNTLFTTGFPIGYDSTSERDRRAFVIVRSGITWPIPDIAKTFKYGDMVVREGCTVYKHMCYEEWLDSKDIKPDDKKHYATICDADIQWIQLMDGYKACNINRIYQKRAPSLFEAVAWADKMATHTLSADLKNGDDIWEVDGRKWYATEFDKVPDFPYFHGYPASSDWSEYNGEERLARHDPATGRWHPETSYIGNMHPCDRQFTFEYGKYAIFLIEELDFTGCDQHTIDHFTRDNIFIDFNPGSHVLCLASPVLHFLQDLGVKWRASHVWVCYGVVDDWIQIGTPSASKRMRDTMVKDKTYAYAVGRLMSGRWPIMCSQYITPDETMASDLVKCHSTEFVSGPDCKVYHDGVHRKHSADSIMYAEDNTVYGAKTVSGSSMLRGGYFTKRASGGVSIEGAPYIVNTRVDMYGLGTTFSHLSGAVHAMCFVQLYRATLCIPPEHVAGFNLDSIKCYVDPTGYLSSFISGSDNVQGSFKPAELKKIVLQRSGTHSLLSNLYTPRAAFQGYAAPDPHRPLWGPYQDSLGQFNIVTGPAGSGKTWRHLRKHGLTDCRVDKVLFAPMTNYLAALLKSQGVPSITSFKAFNRRVNDENRVGDARDRYKSDKIDQRSRLNGYACILRDEVTMDNAAMVLDAVKCCNENHKQLLLVGDFDQDRFYQLSAVRGGGPTLMSQAISDASNSIGSKKIKWIEPHIVYRQTGDPELAELLATLRNHPGDTTERWNTFSNSPLFDRCSYEVMLDTIVPEKDIVISPWHKIISEVTSDVLDTMAGTDVLLLRGNFKTPYKTKESDPDPIRRLAVFDNDPMAHKGVTIPISKHEFYELEGTKWMDKGFPYAGGSDTGNLVNPMIGTTVFSLQGVTLEPDATLWVLVTMPGDFEWLSDEQPCQAYVTASRVRTRRQLRFVFKDRAIRRTA